MILNGKRQNSVQHCPGNPRQCTMKEREIKVIRIGKKREVSLFRDDVFVYVENPIYKKEK